MIKVKKNLYRLTKSKFILGLQCEKALYLDIYKPQLAYFAPETIARFRRGREFETKVKGLFPNAIDISRQLGRNINRYPELTANLLLQPGEVTICEAGFVFNEVLVLADVVNKKADGTINVFEIKNSLAVKDVFRQDVNLQYYVISNQVKRLTSFQVVYNDGDNNPLFHELIEEAESNMQETASHVERFKTILQGLEPTIKTGEYCKKPYECPFMRYCNGKTSAQLELGYLQ